MVLICSHLMLRLCFLEIAEVLKPSAFKEANYTQSIDTLTKITDPEMNAYSDAVKYIHSNSKTQDIDLRGLNRLSSIKIQPIELEDEDVTIEDCNQKNGNDDEALIDTSKPMPRQAFVPSRLSIHSPERKKDPLGTHSPLLKSDGPIPSRKQTEEIEDILNLQGNISFVQETLI